MMAMAVVVAVVSLAPVPAAAQSPTVAAKTWTPPRTPDGQPDVQGFWNFRPDGIMATYSIEEGASEVHTEITGQRLGRGKPIIVDPADGKVPYQLWAAARRKEVQDNYQDPMKLEHIDPRIRCFLEGVPRAIYQGGIQILQLPGRLVILREHGHTYRSIPLDGRPHVGDTVKLWMGDSRGHWEGTTLVVDVTNHNDKTWFDIVGTFHSDALHVVERWTFVDADTLHYEATIEDPKVFTRPWKMAFPLLRNKRRRF